MFGANKSLRKQETIEGYKRLLEGFVSLPFDDEAASAYGATRAHLERMGTLIGHNDLQIASIAQANGCVVVTRNEREFRRVPGLPMEVWD
jgi:tRNA(fMet)-specific endonuclease VapC